MRIAILEIAPIGHYTFVESLVQIYSSLPTNEIVIFTNYKGKEILQNIVNQQVSFCVKEDTEEYSVFFKRIKNFDRLLVTTLESYTKELYFITKQFINIDFNCPIYYTIHNIDMWFGRNLWSKIQNTFFYLPNIENTLYQAKIQFKYFDIHQRIIKKIKKSNGHFVVLSEILGKELAKFIDNQQIKIIPFSIFDKNLQNNSQNNSKIRVCITGAISAIRRDYESIFQLMEKENYSLKNSIEWDLLGGVHPNEGGQNIADKAKYLIKKGHTILVYNERFISMKAFDEALSKADLVLGNMHLQQGATGRYGKSKETGVIFTMIKAAKVGLLPQEYECEPALKTSILTFRDYNDLMKILEDFVRNPQKLAMLKQEARKNAEFYSPEKVYQRIEN